MALQVRAAEAAKILKRCDANEDGVLGQDEFEQYYMQVFARALLGPC